jgi:hypothetical protein
VKGRTKIAILLALGAALGVPGSALANGGDSCVGESAQAYHSVFMSTAQQSPGAVGDLVRDFRLNPDLWCP